MGTKLRNPAHDTLFDNKLRWDGWVGLRARENSINPMITTYKQQRGNTVKTNIVSRATEYKYEMDFPVDE